MKAILFQDDPQFWFETQRALGHAAYGGADTGEVLETASRIVAGDYESWYREWWALAERLGADAVRDETAGHPVTARDSYLRASNYYRTADFFLHADPTDPRISEAYTRSVETFHSAIRLGETDIEAVAIPFEGTVLHGYFYRAKGDGARPAIIMHTGFDGSAEEMHFFGAAAALERGYHVLSFDGPGQPAALHHDGLVFRPDWENVVTPVLDWLIATRPDVDPERISLLGVSMGGVLAPRAAAFEHRLAACIAVDGVFDLGIAATGNLPIPREQAEALLRADESPELDAALEQVIAADPTVRWATSHGQWVMGVTSPRKFLASYLDYTVAGGIAEKVTCPTLVCEAEEDLFFAGQPELLYEHLGGPKTLMRFTADEGAGAHCHSGALRYSFGRIYDWLDDTLAA